MTGTTKVSPAVSQALGRFNQHIMTGQQSSNIEIAPPMDWAPETLQPLLSQGLGIDFSRWSPAQQDDFMNKVYGMGKNDVLTYALHNQPGAGPDPIPNFKYR